MSEPRAIAAELREIAPGVLHWSVADERICWRSEAYAALAPGRAVLVDPLPLPPELLERLGTVAAICLTSASHQRSAWRYRRLFRCPVYAPAEAAGLEEAPDRSFRHDAQLPGNLWALHAPGPAVAHYALQIERREGGPVLFLGDLLVRGDGGPLALLDADHAEVPDQVRESARRLAALEPGVLCPGHGAPCTEGAAAALREAVLRGP